MRNLPDNCLIIFSSKHCGPCKQLKPIIKELMEEVKFNLVELDVEVEEDSTKKYQVRSVPTILLQKDGKIIKSIIGLGSKTQIKNLIKEII